MTKAARWQAGKRRNALQVLRSINARPDQDFHTLSASQIEALLIEADRQRYQKPKNANGSRGRYFYALIQRQARLGHLGARF
jgi:hypothetical protein